MPYLTILVKKNANRRARRDVEIGCNAAVGEQRFAGKPVQDSCCMSVLHALLNVAHKVQRYILFSVASELVSDVNFHAIMLYIESQHEGQLRLDLWLLLLNAP